MKETRGGVGNRVRKWLMVWVTGSRNGLWCGRQGQETAYGVKETRGGVGDRVKKRLMVW